MDGIAGDVVTEIIGGAVGDAGLDSSTGDPHAKVARVMIAPIILAREFTLTVNRAAEFAAEDHKRIVEQTTLLEILHQRGGRLISVHALVFDLRGQ